MYRTAGRQVLVVDDDENIRNLLSAFSHCMGMKLPQPVMGKRHWTY